MACRFIARAVGEADVEKIELRDARRRVEPGKIGMACGQRLKTAPVQRRVERVAESDVESREIARVLKADGVGQQAAVGRIIGRQFGRAH